MPQRHRRPISPSDRKSHPASQATLTHHHPLRPRPGLLENHRQRLANQRMERMSNNDRVRNRTRLGRTGPMPGPWGYRVAGSDPACPAWGYAPAAKAGADTVPARSSSASSVEEGPHPGHPGFFDIIDRDAIDARGATVGGTRRPTPATSHRCGRACRNRHGIDVWDPAWRCDKARVGGLERGPDHRPA